MTLHLCDHAAQLILTTMTATAAQGEFTVLDKKRHLNVFAQTGLPTQRRT